MTLDELIDNVAGEPPRTVTRPTNTLAPGPVNGAKRQGGMLLTELFAGASRGEPRTVRHGHILGPPASSQALDEWQRRFPRHHLPADLKALVARVNGIHLWANLETGRTYEGLAPIEEWELARVKMYGKDGDSTLLDDRYVALSYHADAAAFIVLDADSGRYFLMDSSGPDETCPIGASADELLDWVWHHRIEPRSMA
jgi:hypothetical protein